MFHQVEARFSPSLSLVSARLPRIFVLLVIYARLPRIFVFLVILYLFALLFLGYSFDFWGKVLSSAKGCEVLGCLPFPYRSIYSSRAMPCSYWSYMGYISMFISICLGSVSCLGTSFLFTYLFLVPVFSEGSYYFYLECSRSGRVLHSFLLVVFSHEAIISFCRPYAGSCFVTW